MKKNHWKHINISRLLNYKKKKVENSPDLFQKESQVKVTWQHWMRLLDWTLWRFSPERFFLRASFSSFRVWKVWWLSKKAKAGKEKTAVSSGQIQSEWWVSYNFHHSVGQQKLNICSLCRISSDLLRVRPFSGSYLGPGCGGNSLSRVPWTSLSPATSSNSS